MRHKARVHVFFIPRNVHEQRLQVDDRAMKMLEKIPRRVNALAEDDPTLGRPS